MQEEEGQQDAAEADRGDGVFVSVCYEKWVLQSITVEWC